MNVLLLEKEALDDAVATALTESGYLVSRTTQPDQALELVRTRRVDAMLLDTGCGEALIGKAKELVPELPVIALGHEDAALAAARIVGRGALGYLPIANGQPLTPELRQGLLNMLARAAARLRVEADRRLAHEENQRTRKFFEDVLTDVGQGIVVVDKEGQISFCNPKASQILGLSDDGDSAQHGGEAAVPLLQMLVETVVDEQPRHRMIALEQDDEQVFLDATTSLLRAADGQVTGAIGIVSDRSTEKLLEQQLVHSERLATLGSLLASIAHEITNTLTSITACAEMGLEVAEAAEEAAQEAADSKTNPVDALHTLSREIREIFDMTLKAGLSAQTIADNMLQYSRQGMPGAVERRKLNALVSESLTTLGKHLGLDKVDLRKHFDPAEPVVRVAPSKVQQAVVNLVVNAIQAMQQVDPERRILELTTQIHRQEGKASLQIADHGPGMSPRRLEKIWQSFFTTKRHGTGLGLYITRKVIEDQGGEISVESEVGRGTTFTITLPLD